MLLRAAKMRVVASGSIRAGGAVVSAATEPPGSARRGRHRRHTPELPSGTTVSGRQLSSTSTAAAGGAALSGSEVDASACLMTHQRGTGLTLLSKFRALVLDNSFRPVDVVNWQRAICLDLLEKVDVLEYYEATVSSVNEQFFLPAVLRTRWYGNSNKSPRVNLNRANLLLRDKYQCQYCGHGRELTIDHVMPTSKGGLNTWDNLVACCSTCNGKKGSKTLKQLRWKLRSQPKEPSPHELDFMLAMALGQDLERVPSEWSDYLQPWQAKTARTPANSQQQWLDG